MPECGNSKYQHDKNNPIICLCLEWYTALF
jgi:hypothetical protein